MNNLLYIFVTILSVAVLVWSSPITQCKGGNIEGLQDRIHVDPCGKKKCNLPRGRNVTVTFRFLTDVPEGKVVKSLNNNVQADIGGLRLPFFGVHGTEACGSIYHADDVTKAPCPLEANKEYIYRHVFLVQPIYPELSTKVTWSLDNGGKPVTCFEVPITIVAKKN